MRVPERLTLVEPVEPPVTLAVDQDGEFLVLEIRRGMERKVVVLTEEQAKKLRARINKYIRELR